MISYYFLLFKFLFSYKISKNFGYVGRRGRPRVINFFLNLLSLLNFAVLFEVVQAVMCVS